MEVGHGSLVTWADQPCIQDMNKELGRHTTRTQSSMPIDLIDLTILSPPNHNQTRCPKPSRFIPFSQHHVRSSPDTSKFNIPQPYHTPNPTRQYPDRYQFRPPHRTHLQIITPATPSYSSITTHTPHCIVKYRRNGVCIDAYTLWTYCYSFPP